MTKFEQLFADLAAFLGPLRGALLQTGSPLHKDERLAADRAINTLLYHNPGDLITDHFEQKHDEEQAKREVAPEPEDAHETSDEPQPVTDFNPPQGNAEALTDVAELAGFHSLDIPADTDLHVEHVNDADEPLTEQVEKSHDGDPVNDETGTGSDDTVVQTAESVDGEPSEDGQPVNLNDDPVISTDDGSIPVSEIQDTENEATITQEDAKAAESE